jgi:hypothetical protein
MSLTLGLMAASAAYSTYQQFEASEAEQDRITQQRAFHRTYLTELDRRNSVNEELARNDIQKTQSQIAVSAAALGQSTSGVSTLAAMEEVAALGMEQILRDKQEFDWEMKAEQYKSQAFDDQLSSSKKEQTMNLLGGLFQTGTQFSKLHDSGLKSKAPKKDSKKGKGK